MALNWRRKAASFGFSFASNCRCHSASAQLEAKQDAPTHPLPEQRFLNLVGFEFDAMGQDWFARQRLQRPFHPMFHRPSPIQPGA